MLLPHGYEGKYILPRNEVNTIAHYGGMEYFSAVK